MNTEDDVLLIATALDTEGITAKLKINTRSGKQPVAQANIQQLSLKRKPSKVGNYTVQAGDTLGKLAKKFNTTVDELARLNNIDDANRKNIYVKEKLIVPEMPKVSEKSLFKSNNSLFTIPTAARDNTYVAIPLRFQPEIDETTCTKCKICIIDEQTFFKNYKKQFGEIKKNEQDAISRFLNKFKTYYASKESYCQKEQLAYLLATAKKETNSTFKPVKEAYWLKETSRNKYLESMYDPILGKNANRKKMALDNGNTQKGDGVKYAGRGYVQITWKDNYIKFTEKLNVDLTNDPDKALEIENAAIIAFIGSEEGLFTGKKLSNYINSDKVDYINARRVINGVDAAQEIAGYAQKFEKCLTDQKR